MYIKQIIIHGFKSYRDRIVVEPFDPRHNVVVGRNGSGKSNFFSAIQFVLSDEFSQLRPEQRQLLLHEGSGPRVVSAYVEIIFDNADGRLPIDKSEVTLRRMIGSKKDNYFVNRTTVPRSDVMHLLESAGFTRSNPYYIVKQGEINQMATATESQRLKLLREVAGTRVYDEKTEESRAIVNETRVKLEKAAEFLQTIEERLQALEEEKEELREYQRWDKQRRCIEYTVYHRECKETKQKLVEVKESHATSAVERQTLGRVAKRAQENICAAVARWKIAKEEFKTAKQNQSIQSEELQRLIQKTTNLSLTINDLRDEINNNEVSKNSVEAELEDLQQRINEKMKELELINPEYEKLVREEEELKCNLTLKEQKRKEIYTKLGRGSQFDSKEARDAWIQEQLYQLDKQIEDKQAHCREIQNILASDRAKQGSLETQIETQIKEMEEQTRLIDSHKRNRYRLMEENEQAQSMLKELYREESTLQAPLSSEKENLLQVQQSLRLMVGKPVLDGRDSVRKVLESFRESPGTSGEVDGYCGQVIDNFSCEIGAYTAVEVIAGKRLFHHIVETERTGTKILKEVNRRCLPGEVTFMPLNRLSVSKPNYPVSADAVPLITKLVYDAKYDKALRFIFGKILICRTIEIATNLARESGLDCVTTDGDLVSSSGSLTGGYCNRDKTPLGNYKTRTDIVTKISDLENQLATVQAEISRITQTLISNITKIQRTEALIAKSNNSYETMAAGIRAMKDELSVIRSYRIPNERSLTKCLSNLSAMNETKVGWEQELDQDLTVQLSAAEHVFLNTLNEDIRRLTKQSKMAFEKRLNSEPEKTKLENLLANNLTRRRDELTQMLQKMSGQDRQHRLESCLIQLDNAKEEENMVKNVIQAQSEKVASALRTEKSELEELEKWKMVKKDAQEKIEAIDKVLATFTNKKIIYEQQIAEVTKKIAELGALPRPEAYEKFSTMLNKDLIKELDKTNSQLKKYRHVNKKALDQFMMFSDQKEKLRKRKEELDRGNDKIQELMSTLEHQKYEAIQFTFKQVSKYFEEVFHKLVPSGHATLVMNISDGGSSQEEESGAADSDSFVGIGIRASFTGQGTETNEVNQLSGGEKSLVALAMIFAIQKCDPAPFYLFDEIDQALDAQHREAVAMMINELSSDAQFITTTFKPEMLRQANKFYGVKYGNNVSHIECVRQEEAADFMEGATSDE